ncbi:hypothetical protein [Granulicella mallensis]|uniref:Uncharacterized protein n=1 Tax=Granulicella mallensis TaxID=940614 RepID=A0A7W8E9P1_9BACT|nr:hypothetical protein [Granulicella mallensis]MBB5064668.1 hypothetical protein [Granulicella mallensis]
MNLRTKLTAAVTLTFLAASALPASAGVFGKKKTDQTVTRKPTPAQNALIDKAILREAAVIKTLRERQPLVETYIQNMRPDPAMIQVPEMDAHYLTRINFGREITEVGYADGKKDSTGKFSGIKQALGGLAGLTKSLHLSYDEGGFVRMVVIDTNGPNGDAFDRQHYNFYFVRNDFLGTVPTVVFDVEPIKRSAGRFFGRVWVERNGGNIVRYNGDLAGEDKDRAEFYHFDSWRTNVQDGLWMPTASYIEESDPKSPAHVLKFKAVSHIWGYSLKIPNKDTDQTSLEVEGAIDTSQQAPDVSPLQAQREWVQQAEDNVIDRLYTAGLVDAPSDFDKTLSDLANNILAYNQIPTARPLKVRILLTTPLESLSIGNTILISKSLIDTTAIPTTDGAQQGANLNALLAFQVAHILLGHRVDTKYAFSDRLLFPSERAFQRLPMHHTNAENVEAAKKAMELLNAKDLADGQKYFSLYLQQLQAREKGLPELNKPQIGDGLLKPDGTFWMQAIVSKGPKLDNNDLKQQGAMPLGQYLRYDAWTDQVIQMHTTYEPLLSSRDKIPFEITPVYQRLAYWQPTAAPVAAPAAAPAPAADNAPVDNAPAVQPTQPQPTTGTSTPPQN